MNERMLDPRHPLASRALPTENVFEAWGQAHRAFFAGPTPGGAQAAIDAYRRYVLVAEGNGDLVVAYRLRIYAKLAALHQ